VLTIDYSLLEVEGSHRLLDVGCGEGRHSWAAYSKFDCRVCALDMEQAGLKKTRYMFQVLDNEHNLGGRWMAVRGDAMRLPLKDSAFDRVICSEVLEHVHDDGQSLAELVRVLKSGGIMAVSVPTYLTESIYWRISKSYCNKSGGHVRKYKAAEIGDLLRSQNLQIFSVRHKHSLHSIYWLLRCIFGINNEKAFVPSLYHRFLVWDLKTRTRPVRFLDDVCNRLFPKSIVVYARKGEDGLRPEAA
jgi:ubiquinone/menaquinone biosynthesis C-methylase UbiE